MKLNYYLFKSGTASFEELYIAEKVTEERNYTELHPAEGNNCDFEYKVFIQRNKTKRPKWLSFIEGHVNIPDSEDIFNSVNSFIILIKVNFQNLDYYYAVTGGFGFTAINRNNIEPGFGLKVALNSIDPNNIKTCDVRNVDKNTKQQRVLFSNGNNIQDFSFDFDQDLLNIIAGKPTNSTLGSNLNGSDSLSLKSNVDFPSLGQKCLELTQLYLSNIYVQNFGFIDNIKHIKDNPTILTLNNLLVRAINNKDLTNVAFTYPDMIDYQNCDSFKIKFGRNNAEFEEITLQIVYDFINQTQLSSTDLKDIKILGLSDGMPKTSFVSLFEFLVFETDHSNKKYIFSLKKWYEVNTEYLSNINQQVLAIPSNIPPNYFPALQNNEAEKDYIIRLSSQFLKLDRQNFQIPNSRSKIEICDAYENNNFICIKKGTSSATLSHLFSQGSVSMTLLKDYDFYRDTCCSTVNQFYPNLNLDPSNFNYSNFNLIYAIASDKPGDIRDILPFFSKVNLLQHYKTIKRLGINVEICKIEVV